MPNIVNVGYDSANYYVIATPAARLLVDVGWPGTLPKLQATLKRMGVPLASIIAIDGPAGSGKSTVGQQLAQRLDYLYFDTGVMYRAMTLACLRGGTPVDDQGAVEALAQRVAIDVRAPTVEDGRQYDVLLEGEDVTWDLRAPEVEGSVSLVSAYPGVRRAMSARQREIGLRGKVVMVGRDIGTVVLPEADLKVYLDASVKERARRRC